MGLWPCWGSLIVAGGNWANALGVGSAVAVTVGNCPRKESCSSSGVAGIVDFAT